MLLYTIPVPFALSLPFLPSCLILPAPWKAGCLFRVVGSAGRGRVVGRPQGVVHREKNPNDIDQVPPLTPPLFLGLKPSGVGSAAICYVTCSQASTPKKGCRPQGL